MITVKPNKTALIAITPNGIKLGTLLKEEFSCDLYTSKELAHPPFVAFEESMRKTVRTLFHHYDLLIFICATGITVRMIAPYVEDKLSDPAVLVIDDRGNFVISLLSGHIGGANEWAVNIATIIGATPVITTATDVNGKSSLDTLIKAVNADPYLHRDSIKLVNQKLVKGESIGLYIEDPSLIPKIRTLEGFLLLDHFETIPNELTHLVVITNKHKFDYPSSLSVIIICPRNVVLGIGCKLNTPFEKIYTELRAHLDEYNIALSALSIMGSVSLKKDEEGLIALSKKLNIPFLTFTVEELKPYAEYFPKSAWVEKVLGIGSVSQPVAWLLSNGHLMGNTLKQSGITLTLGLKE